MVQKLKPLTDRIGRFFQRLSPQAIKYTIWATIAVVSFAFGLIIALSLIIRKKRPTPALPV